MKDEDKEIYISAENVCTFLIENILKKRKEGCNNGSGEEYDHDRGDALLKSAGVQCPHSSHVNEYQQDIIPESDPDVTVCDIDEEEDDELEYDDDMELD